VDDKDFVAVQTITLPIADALQISQISNT